MKLLVVNFEYPPLGGGGGVATKDLVEELVTRGHDVFVLTTWYKGLAYEETIAGVKIRRVPVIGRRRLEAATLISLFSFVPRALWVGWRICQQEKFDVINAQFVLPSGLVALGLAKLGKIPMVVSLIGGDIYDPSKSMSPHRHWWLRIAVNYVCRQAVALTAISQDTAERAREFHNVKKEIFVVPIGIPRRENKVVKQHSTSPAKKIVTIGRLIPRKQYPVLLEALKKLPGMELVVIGSGPLEEELKKKTHEFELVNRVKWAGHVSENEKAAILAEADIYVSSASHAGFGLVFLEAMAAGLPIVATNVGGQLDFLEQNKNALLVPANDTESLVKALVKLANDLELRRRMSDNNLTKVKDYYWDNLAGKFEAVLAGKKI